MDLKEAKYFSSDISNHWYYLSKAKAMMRHLEGRSLCTILDIGAGSGFFSSYLLKNSMATEAWCIDTSYEFNMNSMVLDKKIHYRRSMNAPEADLVLLMDVLEHVDDDIALLEGYARKLPSNTTFLLSVPAFHFLWSGHDDFLEHRRRYTLKQLELVASSAGLKVVRSSYYFGAVFPIAAVIRLTWKFLRSSRPPRSQLIRHHSIVNIALTLLCRIELPFMMLNRLAGLTVFCLAVKP